MKNAAPQTRPKVLKQPRPACRIIEKYSHRPAKPSAPMRRIKTISFPEKITNNAITHIAIALANLRRKRLICHRWGEAPAAAFRFHPVLAG
jgi:hypothetical protein